MAGVGRLLPTDLLYISVINSLAAKKPLFLTMAEISNKSNDITATEAAGLLVDHFGAAAGTRLDFALAVAVEAGDALIKLAFRRDPEGDQAVLAEAKTLIRDYLHRHVNTIARP